MQTELQAWPCTSCQQSCNAAGHAYDPPWTSDSMHASSQHFHQMLVNFGLRCVESKTDVAEDDEKRWETSQKKQDEEMFEISLLGFESVMQPSPCVRFGESIDLLHTWLRKLLTAEDAIPMWLCSYQLLAHYQGSTKRIGFWYDAAAKRWGVADEVIHTQQFDYLRLAAWLQALIKDYASVLELPVKATPRLPWGSTFKAYQRCLYLKASPGEMTRIDAAFRRAGFVNIKKVRPALTKLDDMTDCL